MAQKCPDRARGLENSRFNRNGEKKRNLQTYLKHSDHDSRYAFRAINETYGIAYSLEERSERNEWLIVTTYNNDCRAGPWGITRGHSAGEAVYGSQLGSPRLILVFP